MIKMINSDLLKALNLDIGLEQKLIYAFSNNGEKIDRLCRICKEKSFSVLAKENDITRLAVCVRYCEYTREFYNQKGISDEIFYDTVKDISVWCKNNDNKGLKNYSWIKNHLKGELFRIGRLQFQMFQCKNVKLKYDLLPFDFGDNLIYDHIPQGEKLIFSDCVDSLLNAKAFFAKYVPDFEYEFFFCESWLLYNENWQFMKTDCNILQFQSLFDIVYSDDNDSQAVERIFGKRHLLKSKYPENTSLQKSAKKFMLDGNKLGIGIGIIAKDEI